MVERSLDGMLT